MSRPAPGEGRLSPRDLAGVALLGILLFLPGLGNHDLWAPDEPRYAQVAREMLVDGDWLLPHVNGRVYTDKPPGWFWCAAVLSLPGGDVTPFTARLPSALAAILVLMITAAAGARLLGRRAGLLAAVVLASSYLFFEMARSAHLDLLLCLLTTMALLAAWRAMREGGGVGEGLLLWSALAGAMMVKGPVGLVVPLLVLVVDRIIAGEPRDLLRLRPAWGLPLAILPPVVWLLAVDVFRPGYSPLGVLDRHVISRFGSGLHHARPFWYYAGDFFEEMLPWSFLVPAAMVLVWRWRAVAARAPEVEDGPAAAPGWERRRFLLVWVATILVFFSISTEKRSVYILPLFPAAALLVGDLWHRLMEGDPSRGRRPPPALVVAGLILSALIFLALGSVPFLLGRWPEEITSILGGPARMLAVGAGAGGVAILVLLFLHRRAAAFAAQALAALVCFLVFVHAVQPAVNPFKSARALSETLVRERRPGEAVGMLHWRAAYLYYSGIRMAEVREEEAGDWMREPGGRLLLLSEDTFDSLRDDLGPVEILAQGGVGHREMMILRKVGLAAPLDGAP